jgi:hypothetical protein
VRLIRIVRLVRALGRLFKSSKAGGKVTDSLTFSQYGILFAFTQSILIVMVMLHWVCCIWVMFLYEEDAGLDNWLYLEELVDEQRNPLVPASDMYQSVLYKTTSMFVAGEDIGASTPAEKTCAVFFSLLGVGVVAVLFGKVIAIVETLNAASREYNDKMKDVARIMESLKLPAPLVKRVRRFYDCKLFGISQPQWQYYLLLI